MLRVTLDGALVHNRDDLHDALAAALSLPEWYGRNLDALYDCLSELSGETELCILRPDALIEALEGYANALFSLLRDAERENPRLHVVIEEDN